MNISISGRGPTRYPEGPRAFQIIELARRFGRGLLGNVADRIEPEQVPGLKLVSDAAHQKARSRCIPDDDRVADEDLKSE
jgi:hypothetical protein